MPPKDPEARRAYMKAWYENNRDRARENQKRYEERNRERIRERARERYQANRERILVAQKERSKDPAVKEQRRLAQARRRAKNPERDRELSRRAHIKNKYGLTLEEYDAILARGCAICGSKAGRVVGKRNSLPPPPPRLCLDHDHANGKVRDALCHTCNVGIGAFADDPTRLRAAADYLEKHRT